MPPAQLAEEQRTPRSQVRGRTQSTSEQGHSSSSKRQKIDHTAFPVTPVKGSTGAITGTSAMYSFPQSTSGYVIDLTSDSPRSSRTSTPAKLATKSAATSLAISAPGSNTPRKFVVRNVKQSSAAAGDPQQYFSRVWASLEPALELIFAKTERPQSLEEKYKGVETVCRQGKAAELFQKLQYKCREHISGPVRAEVLSSVEQKDGVATLRAVVKAWQNWRKQMNIVKTIFLYLNQAYLLGSKTEPTIDEISVALFRTHIFKDTALHSVILESSCTLVAALRGQSPTAFDATLLEGTVDMLHDLAVYTKYFEPKLLTESQEFFKSWSDAKVKELGLPSYVTAAWKLIDQEDQMCEKFGLDASTRRNIREQAESFLVNDQVEYLTKPDAVGYLIGEDEFESLTHLYKLLQLKHHEAALRPAFEAHIEESGESIIFDEKREQEMVPRLLAFKRKLDHVYSDCFNKQADLGIGLREAFRKFINKTKKSNMTWGTDNEKPGEMIAKYVDMLLRGGLKAIADDADEDEEVDGDEKMNQQLTQVLELFRFLNGKAVFEAFYKKDLAKRLLLKQSANDRAEKNMLERLKNECGANFTSNLEQMFKDIDLSRDENAAYKMRRQDRGEKGGPDLEVNVLEQSAWPTYADVPIEIPLDIQKAAVGFEDHYKSHHSGRSLKWKHDRAFCQLNARFDKNYVIVVSAFQAIVLLYFNDKDAATPVTFSELGAATKLSKADLVRTLQSLACARYRVLKKSTKGPEVAESDTFTVNTAFKSDKVRIKINQIQLKETREENKATHERVAVDREFETQAAIVRIMKAEQKIKHQNLIVKVIEALSKRGHVSPEDIKKQIDKLIDKDYMERADDNMYEYVA